MPKDVVEVVVACHDPRRPLERLLRSVDAQRESLGAIGADLRMTVVCHNLPLEELASALSDEIRDRIELKQLRDDIYSPAGPMNTGISSSRATWLTTVGSDDTLAAGSLAAWLTRGRDVAADAVIPPIRVPRGVVSTPVMRPGRRDVLDPVADHLAYRTAPLGLFRVETLHAIGFAYTEADLPAGSDIEPALRLWFRGGRITYAYRAPAYLVSEDMGGSRVTSTVGRVARETGWLPPLLQQAWLRDARVAERQEISTKLARAQLVNAVRRRAELATDVSDAWLAEDATAVDRGFRGLIDLAGGPLRGLSRAEVALLSESAEAIDHAAVRAAWQRANDGGPARRVLPRRLSDIVRRDGRPRMFLQQQLAQRLGSYDHPGIEEGMNGSGRKSRLAVTQRADPGSDD